MKFKNQSLIIILTIFTLIFLLQSCDKPTEPPKENPPQKLKLFINEFMASNKSTIQDEKGQYDDWVEIYNGEDSTINMNNFFLTDDFTKKNKWQFPDITIEPKKFLLIWCDEDSSQGIRHANFKLSAAGEQIGIFGLDGKVIDTITYGVQKTDTSYGRFPDGYDFWKFMSPTPNSSNK
jgi:hypothetical protein